MLRELERVREVSKEATLRRNRNSGLFEVRMGHPSSGVEVECLLGRVVIEDLLRGLLLGLLLDGGVGRGRREGDQDRFLRSLGPDSRERDGSSLVDLAVVLKMGLLLAPDDAVGSVDRSVLSLDELSPAQPLNETTGERTSPTLECLAGSAFLPFVRKRSGVGGDSLCRPCNGSQRRSWGPPEDRAPFPQ